MQHIIQSKDVERRRLRALPWLEKLEILGRLRQRQIWMQAMRPSGNEKSTRVWREGESD